VPLPAPKTFLCPVIPGVFWNLLSSLGDVSSPSFPPPLVALFSQTVIRLSFFSLFPISADLEQVPSLRFLTPLTFEPGFYASYPGPIFPSIFFPTLPAPTFVSRPFFFV